MSVNLLEKTILNKVDELISVLITLSKKDEGFEELSKKCVEKTEEIIPLILHYIDGKTSLVIPLLYQLIMEKLPDKRIISSFGSLQEEVNSLINTIKAKYANNNVMGLYEGSDKYEEKNGNQKLSRGLHYTVSKAFPSLKVYSDYRIGGEYVEIYIPDLKLILLTENNKPSLILKYYCSERNLKIIHIPVDVAKDYRRLTRFIRQNQK